MVIELCRIRSFVRRLPEASQDDLRRAWVEYGGEGEAPYERDELVSHLKKFTRLYCADMGIDPKEVGL